MCLVYIYSFTANSYGEESWCSAVKKHVLDSEKFNAYDTAALEKYESTLDWLKEWACTRQFGLGTYLPWDKEWVIESLSDSTIYMSYYTIAHYLQGEDNLNGEESKSPHGIKVADLTDERDLTFRRIAIFRRRSSKK
jgi:leucyl-tRNA synthetase